MSTIILLDSGYEVSVPLFGPFVFDRIAQRYPMPDPVTRPIHLAGGDVVQTAYKPPAEQPDKDDGIEFALWARHQAYLLAALQMQQKRNREQAHFFMLSVDVISGPHNKLMTWAINMVKWWLRSFGKPLDKMLLRKQHLTFLKLYVIVSLSDWQKIQDASLAKEVTLTDVLDIAKQTFRSDVGRGDAEGGA